MSSSLAEKLRMFPAELILPIQTFIGEFHFIVDENEHIVGMIKKGHAANIIDRQTSKYDWA